MQKKSSYFHQKWQIVIAYSYIILGSLIASIAYPLFLVPNNIPPGGVTGIATVLHAIFNKIPVGLSSLIMNIPIFLFGFKSMGHTFAIRSFFTTVIFSLLIDLFAPFVPVMTDDMLLASVFGGGLLGIGLGLIFKGGATTGGTDMIAKMIHKRFPIVGVGTFLLIIDFIVIAAAGIFVNSKLMLYALICIYIAAKSIDLVLEGFYTSKSCYIITEHYEIISNRILIELERGVTHINAKGAYTGENRPIILCIVSVQEIPSIKTIVSEEDKNAFMFINDTKETLGEGFKEFSSEF